MKVTNQMKQEVLEAFTYLSTFGYQPLGETLLQKAVDKYGDAAVTQIIEDKTFEKWSEVQDKIIQEKLAALKDEMELLKEEYGVTSDD